MKAKALFQVRASVFKAIYKSLNVCDYKVTNVMRQVGAPLVRHIILYVFLTGLSRITYGRI